MIDPVAPLRLGLVADPGLPTEIAHALAEDLAGQVLESGRECAVQVVSEPLTLDDRGVVQVLSIARNHLEERSWDAAVLLSDLPRRAGSQPVVADLVTGDRVGLISLPALGAIAQYRRARATMRAVRDHLTGSGEFTVRGGRMPPGLSELTAGRAESGLDAAAVDEQFDVRLGLPGWRGRIRLLTGMVRANRPWRLVPSLSSAIAAAAAGAAFGIFYSNIWSLAAQMGSVRLLVVMLLTLLGMVFWLIVDNQLWERPDNRELREEAVLSNASTALTIGTGVLIMYGLLFAISLVGALVVIPPGYLGKNLSHPAGVGDYLLVAWLSCSLGTIGGALGSGFAGEGAVRQAAYSQRERERRERLDQRDSRESSGPSR